MMGNKVLFLSLKKVGGSVVFGTNGKGTVVKVGYIGNNTFKLLNVLLVNGFGHNLISISQLNDKAMSILF